MIAERRIVLHSLVLILSGAACGPALLAQQDEARAIVDRSIKADNRNENLRRNYVYKIYEETRDLDSSGKVKATHSTLDEMLYVGLRNHRRLLERDGKPLSPADEKKEREKLDRASAAASRLSDDERRRREDAARERQAKNRERMRHILDAFDFRLLGEEPLEGRPAWRIQAAPKPGYKGPDAFLFRNIAGTLWIDKQDYAWVRMEAETLDTISIGFFVARLAKGTRLSFENFKVNGEVWVPKRAAFSGSARLAVLKKLSEEQEVRYSDYRKFQTDSRLVDVE